MYVLQQIISQNTSKCNNTVICPRSKKANNFMEKFNTFSVSLYNISVKFVTLHLDDNIVDDQNRRCKLLHLTCPRQQILSTTLLFRIFPGNVSRLLQGIIDEFRGDCSRKIFEKPTVSLAFHSAWRVNSAPQIFPPFHTSRHLDRTEMSTPTIRLKNLITKTLFHSHFREDSFKKVSPQIKILVFSMTGYFALILCLFTP